MKLITYDLIEKLEEERGFQDEHFKPSVLFFADDELLLSRSEGYTGRMTDTLIKMCETNVWKINKEKDSILIFNTKESLKELRHKGDARNTVSGN